MEIVTCTICGEYLIAGTCGATIKLSDRNQKILSGIIRNRTINGIKTEIDTSNIDELLDSASIPSDPIDKLNMLISYISKNSESLDKFVGINLDLDYSIFYLSSNQELIYLIESAKKMDLVRDQGTGLYGLTFEGWKYAAELKKIKRKSNQAFVAMWFDDSLKDVWEKGFKPALEETGYEPIRIDMIEHNQKICDEIIAKIRKSGLLIADFTGNRGGVYYEAGFAQGLGIPVIWTCQDGEWIDKLHFDTRQFNHITWKDVDDLKDKLINRINATVPLII